MKIFFAFLFFLAAVSSDARQSLTFDCSFTRMALTVRFLGEIRPISAERKLLIAEAPKAFPHLEKVFALYEDEIQVVAEAGKPFWMPVQKQVLVQFKEEVKKDDRVRLFCQHLGSVNDSESVLLMIDFEKVSPAPVRKL